MKIVWDLDGVIRDLSGEITKRYMPDFKITTWYWKYKDLDVYDYVNRNKAILEECPVTEYYEIAKEIPDLVIWTRQPDSWIYGTVKWVQKYLPRASMRIFGPQECKEESILSDCDYIIEDYPMFKNYDKVILIDRPYNQEVESKIRIKTPEMLREVLCK